VAGCGRRAAAAGTARQFRARCPQWVIKNPVIATTVPSMTDVDQLEQNFSVMAQQFTDSDQKILTARLEEITPTSAACAARVPANVPGSAGG